MKMNKKIILPIITLISSLILTSCTHDDNYLERPSDTNLEFWITQKVNEQEFKDKGCTYLPGWIGAEEYLDSRYVADTSEEMAKAPDVCVTYLLTGYPDLKDNPAITRIVITDPSITVYGLTINTSESAKIERMHPICTRFSFVTTTEECYFSCGVGRCTFSFMSDRIIIDASTTNNSNIVY